MNHVILIGHVGADPDVRKTKSEKVVCSFRLATSGPAKNKERGTTWHRITVWERQAELCAAYVRKGSKVAVAGRLQTRSYDDAQGKKRYITEVVAHLVNFLDRRSEGDERGNDDQRGGHSESTDVIPF